MRWLPKFLRSRRTPRETDALASPQDHHTVDPADISLVCDNQGLGADLHRLPRSGVDLPRPHHHPRALRMPHPVREPLELGHRGFANLIAGRVVQPHHRDASTGLMRTPIRHSYSAQS